MSKKKKNKGPYIVLLIIFILIFIVCGSVLFKYYSQGKNSEDDYEDLRDLISNTSTPGAVLGPSVSPEIIDPTPTPIESKKPIILIPEPAATYSVAPSAEPTPTAETSSANTTQKPQSTPEPVIKDMSQLKELNSDFVAWLTVPGTKIDYPVVQTNNSPDFYLRKNFYKKYSVAGTLYAKELTDLEAPSDNITIYGHRMHDGTMFAALEKYKKEDFYKAHKYFTLDTIDHAATYEICYVFKTQVYTDSEDEFNYWDYINFEYDSWYDEFIQQIEDKKLYDTGVEVSRDDKFVSLSTCEYSQTNGRLVVVGKLISWTDLNSEQESEQPPEVTPEATEMVSENTIEPNIVDNIENI